MSKEKLIDPEVWATDVIIGDGGVVRLNAEVTITLQSLEQGPFADDPFAPPAGYEKMEMPIGEANLAFVEKLRAQERLYTRFRATRAFEELDQEVQEYEEWKRQQQDGR